MSNKPGPYGAVATHLTCNEKIRGSNPRAGWDSVAEWLRRWIANPLLFERASSNLATVEILLFCIYFLAVSARFGPESSGPSISYLGTY